MERYPDQGRWLDGSSTPHVARVVSGWRSEVWPAPLKGTGAVAARDVLRAKAGGKPSMGLTGVLSCARLYYHPAQHLADLVAGLIGQPPGWNARPEYALEKGDRPLG